MDDLISRQAAIDEIHRAIFEFFDICDDDEESPMTYKDKQILKLNKDITTRLKSLPAADAVEVRHGRWGKVNECSECGCQPWYERDIHFLHYCPNCGARMDGEQDEMC